MDGQVEPTWLGSFNLHGCDDVIQIRIIRGLLILKVGIRTDGKLDSIVVSGVDWRN